VKEWLAQTLHGLVYLHWRGVLHRDLKPANLLLAADGRALQIGDLGSAAQLPGPGPFPAPAPQAPLKGSVCTPVYGSPETILQQTFFAASDLWSTGVTFYEVLVLQPLFPPQAHMEEIENLVGNFDLEKAGSEPVPGGKVRNLGGAALAALSAADKGGSLAKEISELLRADPAWRPPAATLVARPSTQRLLRSLLSETVLEEPNKAAEHFAELAKVLRESREAASAGSFKNQVSFTNL
jgi:serine/threonine protein kinase